MAEKAHPHTSSPASVVRDAPSSDSFEKDVALDLVGEHAQEIDPIVEARVVRKIDLFLIPAMIVGWSLPAPSPYSFSIVLHVIASSISCPKQ